MITLKSSRQLASLFGFAIMFILSGCGESIAIIPPQPTNTPVKMAGVHIPNLEQGQQAWREQQCDACHGPIGLGGIGPVLASTALNYDDFLRIVRTAIPPKPAFTTDMLSDDSAYDIYAWLRTQQPAIGPVGPTLESTESETPSTEEIMGMTIWTCRECDSCHGIFAQGGPESPALAELSYPVEEELTRMRQTADEIPEHSVEHINDEIFANLYEWLQAGCTYTNDCTQ